jgi:acetate kinase
VLDKNLLFVPQLKGNVLTAQRLTDLGLDVNYGNNKHDIMANGKVIATMTANTTVYELNTDEECSVLQAMKNQHVQ